MSRRKFLKQSSLLAGGALLHNKMVHAFASSYIDDKITVGMIGCGDRGKGIMSVLNELNDRFIVTAICDVLDFRIEEAKQIKHVAELKTFQNYKHLLDDKTIQAVVIATPLNLHYVMAAEALQAGKNVYLEKTMTYNIPEALKLIENAKQHKNQTLQVGHQYRYSPLYFKVKEYVEKDYLGKVTQIDCRWDRNGNWRRPVPPGIPDEVINWRMYREFSGGLTAELLAHQIDFINWAFDTNPTGIFATGGIDIYNDGRETYDNMQVMFRYEKDDMIGNFGATCGNAHDGYIFKIKGTKGSVNLLVNDGIYYPESEQKKELETVDGVTGATKIEWNKEGGIPILNGKLKDGTWYALNDFYKSITEKQLPSSNVFTGATTAFCVHLANNAAYTHSIENWKTEYSVLKQEQTVGAECN